MRDQIRGLILGSFVGDAFALGTHWTYNPNKIERDYGRVSDYIDPKNNKYHDKKSLGDLTHYGDQSLVLLRSLAASDGSFDKEHFLHAWQNMWEGYNDYVDTATRETLAALSDGSYANFRGSSSNDLAGAGRGIPLFALSLADNPEELVSAFREQAAMTHADLALVDAAEYFAVVLYEVLQGVSLDDALEKAVSRDYAAMPVREWYELGLSLAEKDTVAAVSEVGADCHVDHAFPATIAILKRHGTSFETALVENTMAGGDSAARGAVVGAILGALHGEKAIPAHWLLGMNAREEIDSLLVALNPELKPTRDLSSPRSTKFTFKNYDGVELCGRLEEPARSPQGVAVFAHCFTCSKDVAAASRISKALAAKGTAVLRFDFTGLGNSEGDFSNTNFSSNVEDIQAAVEAVQQKFLLPTYLVGHSLGGAAVLAAAAHMEGIAGVVTIGAPYDPAHVQHLFAESAGAIEQQGVATVQLAGREFQIKRQFMNDLRDASLLVDLPKLAAPLLVFHSPKDETVQLENGLELFRAAEQPKSFVALEHADHLLTNKADSMYVADVVASWIARNAAATS